MFLKSRQVRFRRIILPRLAKRSSARQLDVRVPQASFTCQCDALALEQSEGGVDRTICMRRQHAYLAEIS